MASSRYRFLIALSCGVSLALWLSIDRRDPVSRGDDLMERAVPVAFGAEAVDRRLVERAIEAYREAEKLRPADATPKQGLAEAHATLGNVAPARRYAERAREVSPDDPLVRRTFEVAWEGNRLSP